MALFESYERRIDKINAVLAQYGINGIEDAKAICDAKGIDPYTMCEETVFVLVNYRHDLHFCVIIVCSDAFVKSCAAVEVMEYKLHYIVDPGRDHADSALEIETENEFIHNHSAEIGSENAENHGLSVIADYGRERNDYSRHRNCRAEPYLQILTEDLSHDVKSTR